MKYLIKFLIILVFASCGDEVLIKPKAKLRLEYPQQEYHKLSTDCPFSFYVNKEANPYLKDNCWINLEYPKMKATIYLTYYSIENNLDSLLYDAQKLTYSHTIKASSIDDLAYEDSIKKVYGMYYEIGGNAATASQFFVTDTLRHFITGSLYFNSNPNYDSIYPAAMYLRDDIRRIMETIEWKDN